MPRMGRLVQKTCRSSWQCKSGEMHNAIVCLYSSDWLLRVTVQTVQTVAVQFSLTVQTDEFKCVQTRCSSGATAGNQSAQGARIDKHD